MGERVISFYEFPERAPDWIFLRTAFKRNLSKFNYPYFVAGSDLEEEFLRFCASSHLPIQRKTVIEYDGDGIQPDKFLYLCLKDDSGSCVAPNQNDFLDLSRACPGGGAFGLCEHGAIQRGDVPVSAKGIEVVARLGLVALRHSHIPIYLLSAAVADALRSAEASGCEIIPTNTPHCFQLRINQQTAGSAHIGLARMGKRCPTCGVAKIFLSDTERYFHPGALNQVDFQNCRVYHAENVGEFEIPNGFPIISQRIFHQLLALGLSGLARYSTDPPIRHAIVQVRE